jgi:hypothetical protein
MGSKQRQAQNGQKASFERNLKDRLTILSGRGIESSEVDKDNLVKKFRANIKAINNRLRAIDANEKKTEELARLKVEKAAAPRKDPDAIKEKKVKAAPAAAKEKPKKKA